MAKSKTAVEIKIRVTEEGIENDALVLEWCRAMERKLLRLLQDSFEQIAEEARWKRDQGFSCGTYHVTKARLRGMDND